MTDPYGMPAASKERFDDRDQLVDSNGHPSIPSPHRSKFNRRNWGLRTKLGVGLGALVLIAGAVVGAVLGVRANRYPSYSKLSYSIRDTYSGTDFFDKFTYFNTYDPTGGWVHYVDADSAAQLNITYASSTQAVLRVDSSDTNASTGRKSARISSKTQYDNGLFIFDVANSPYGCGTWSSVWLADEANWPKNGEIDVVESVNQGTSGNQMTLHTSDGCTMKQAKRKQTATVLETNCLNSTNDNAGCGVQGAADTYGPAFNANGGGVYAMELRDDGIRSWFFARRSVPSDITAGTSPDPSTWSTPFGDFPNTHCDVASHFRNQSIIVNIDLCGSWAGSSSVYTDQDDCPGSCESYVTSNATAFDTAYWAFNSFKVYAAS